MSIPNLPSTKSRTNFIPNPGVETVITGWSGTSGSVPSRVADANMTSGFAVRGTCNGTSNFSSCVTALLPVTAGTTYTFSTLAYASVAGFNSWVEVQWKTGAGANISQSKSPNVALPTSPDLRVVTGVAPATAASCTVAIVIGGIPLSTYFYLSGDWLMEVGAARQTPWFDGDGMNCAWTGTAYASPSTSVLAASQNPALPSIEVAVWPGVNPVINGVPASSPSLISDRAKGFSLSRGRQYELGQDEAASGSIPTNNNDGQVTGGVNGCEPMVNARIRARWQGVTYPIFSGFARSWPTEEQDAATSRTGIELVDAFEALANRPLGTLVAEEALWDAPTPVLHYPLSEPQVSQSAGNVIAGTPWPAAPLVHYKGTLGTGMQFGGAAFLPGSAEGTLTQSNATGATGRGSQVQVVGPQVRSGFVLDMSQPWAVSVFARVSAGKTVVWSALNAAGGLAASIELDATGTGAVSVAVYDTAGTLQGGATWGLGQVLTPGVFVTLGFDGTNVFGSTYGAMPDMNFAYGSGTWLPVAPVWGVSRWVAWGCAFNNSAIFQSSNADLVMAHGMLWTGTVPAPGAVLWDNLAMVGLLGAANRRAASALSWLLRYAGWPASAIPNDPNDGLYLSAMRDLKGSSLLEALKNIALDSMGRFYIGPDGTPQFVGRHAGFGAATKWQIGGNPGEYPYEGSPKFDYDPTYVFNDVEVSRVSSLLQSTTSAVQRWTNPASMASYFQRPLQVTSNVISDADAQNLAQWLANRYAKPAARVEEVTFNPAANPNLWPFVLGVQFGDTATINHRTVSRGNRTFNVQVQKVTHDVDADAGTWLTRIQFTPWSSDWVLAAMHTTFAAASIVGATSVSLNPLPDKATNAAEWSLGRGTTILLDPGTANAETMTIASVVSAPTPNVVNYTTITVTFTAATTKAHALGAVACDPLPVGVTDPTAWDAWSVLGSTTIASF